MAKSMASLRSSGFDVTFPESVKRTGQAVNPNKQADEDTRTPAELLDIIEQKGREVAEAVAALRALYRSAVSNRTDETVISSVNG